MTSFDRIVMIHHLHVALVLGVHQLELDLALVAVLVSVDGAVRLRSAFEVVGVTSTTIFDWGRLVHV